MRRILELPLAVVTALTCLLGMVGMAHANTTPLGTTQILETVDSRKACVDPLIEHPFAQFGDNADYVLAPDGNFDGSVSGWQFAGGAKVVQTDEGRSLQLPKGATAISPSMCLDLNFPTFRMYHKVVKAKSPLVRGSADKAKIKIEVVYHEVNHPEWTDVKEFDGKQGLTAGSGKKLSDPIDLKPDLGGSQSGARQAALRFTVEQAKQGETFLLDDVYVDPMRR